MTKTTKAQRAALARLWARTCETHDMEVPYRVFRKQVQGTFGMDGAVVIPFFGMWVCIETDGYSHT